MSRTTELQTVKSFQEQKRRFKSRIVKEIISKDERLTEIRDFWGKSPKALTEILIVHELDEGITFDYTDHYKIPPSVDAEIEMIFKEIFLS
ncbi:hypothetical protein [Prolixibacter sp. NT017]|uniref:hypothetical protein n=1 Tax=Prolixibacter sp. NT017 TaxID=2652390 RepID=UPI0012724F4B|nr:hypothetical protein [Prolixibacter sp. NT017]GET24862.1 hypothetical protein NT017_11910 [Prolixibacter sp. NT017]